MKSEFSILEVASAGKNHTSSSAVETLTGNVACERPGGASGGIGSPHDPENISRRSVILTAFLPVFDTVTLSAGSVNPRDLVVGPFSIPMT